MKIKSIAKKLPIFVVLSAAIAVAGLIMFFLFGFNVSVELKDKTSIAVTYDAYVNVDDDRRDILEDVAVSAITAKGLDIVDTVNSTETSGGTVEFFFDKSTDTSLLEDALSSVLSDLSANASLSDGTYQGAVHTYVSQGFYTYMWRGAIAVCAGIITAFAYVSIRFKLNMGATVAITALHNVLLTLAFIVIFRIPAGVTIISTIGFSLVYSLMIAVVAMINMRSTYRDENVKILPADEQTQSAYESYDKPVRLISVIAFAAMIILFLCTLFTATQIAYFAAIAALVIGINAYSAYFFMPAVYAPMKKRADAVAAYKASPEYKEKKRSAKGSDKDID